MKLTHKNFLYTSIVTGILAIMVLGYFIFMLPSLYVDHMSKQNYDAICKQHREYLKNRSYEDIVVMNPSCISIEIPFYEDDITISGKAFQAKLAPSTKEMKAILMEIKDFLQSQIGDRKNESTEKNENNESTAKQDNNVKQENSEREIKDFSQMMEQKLTEWGEAFKIETEKMEQVPISIQVITQDFYKENFSSDSVKMHFLDDDTIVVESGATDESNHYTTYLAATFNHNEVVVSVLPAMTPEMNEIAPIVIHSLPMLIAVIILFALVVSYLYSKGMVHPISKLVKHTENVKNNGIEYYEQIPITGKDEIAELSCTLNELYKELHNNYIVLESQNKELEQKNKRQEVFLRSSSHQLKTPIAAAMLLVDGMINQIGKYQDTKTYLPKVKEQLQSMQKMVQDILYLSHCEDNLYKEELPLSKLVKQSLDAHEIEITACKHHVTTNFSKECVIYTDQNIMLSILDSLLSNAILHTENEGTIQITIQENKLIIENEKAHIEEDMLPVIFEPFVGKNGSGHGLGLYIVAYYVDVLNMKVKISNTENGVKATLYLKTTE